MCVLGLGGSLKTYRNRFDHLTNLISVSSLYFINSFLQVTCLFISFIINQPCMSSLTHRQSYSNVAGLQLGACSDERAGTEKRYQSWAHISVNTKQNKMKLNVETGAVWRLSQVVSDAVIFYKNVKIMHFLKHSADEFETTEAMNVYNMTYCGSCKRCEIESILVWFTCFSKQIPESVLNCEYGKY